MERFCPVRALFHNIDCLLTCYARLEYPNYFTVGESPMTHDPADLLPYILPKRKELQMMFQFELADVGTHRPHHSTQSTSN